MHELVLTLKVILFSDLFLNYCESKFFFFFPKEYCSSLSKNFILFPSCLHRYQTSWWSTQISSSGISLAPANHHYRSALPESGALTSNVSSQNYFLRAILLTLMTFKYKHQWTTKRAPHPKLSCPQKAKQHSENDHTTKIIIQI